MALKAAAVLCVALIAAVSVALLHNVSRVELVSKPSLAKEIAELDRKLGLKSPAGSEGVSKHAMPKRRPVRANVEQKSDLQHTHQLKQQHPSPSGKPATTLSKQDALATAMGLWGQIKTSEPWHAEDQESYDRAVQHAQIVEKGGVEVYQPLRMGHAFTHDAEKEDAQFEGQLAHLLQLLEPSYLSEALDWAVSGDKDDNQMLRPVVESMEQPLIKELDDEARIRVDHAVDALAAKNNLSLEEKEQLRAHLMAPLLIRIRERVHTQVTKYVVSTARNVILKAANSSQPGGQRVAAAFQGAAQSVGLHFPEVPHLNEADLKFVNALHDLHAVYKSGVVDRAGYETQRAKLLSDWLKYTVNEAGGNANDVLKMMFGGDVRGVTDTGIKHPSPISVHKKLAMEKGIASLSKDREQRMTRDLVYELIHGKGQWGDLHGCDEKFSSPRCSKAWEQIRYLVDQYARSDDPELHWGNREEAESSLSRGTKNLLHHMTGLKEEAGPSSDSARLKVSVALAAMMGGVLAGIALL